MPRLPVFLPTLLLASFITACSTTNAPTGGWKPDRDEQPADEDADGDGSPTEVDCDDTDGSVFPGATEACNDKDDDCDGDIDEAGATGSGVWYLDGDDDGHGAGEEILACEAPEGGVSSADDCDDTDGTIFPAAPERCNGADDDCDSETDEADAVDAPTWFPDTDLDGYGDPASPIVACAAPEGWIAEGTDCNDGDTEVHPLAAEHCDSIDNDCDSTIDEGYDVDGDGYTTCGGDCDDDDYVVHSGATELCDTLDNDCDGTADSAAVCPCDVQYWPDTLHPYLYCTTATDWTSAEAACSTYGYALVTFDSSAEGIWVETTVAAYTSNYWWVGFTDATTEGSWGWADGSPVTYLNWSSGEPNNGHGGECVATSEEDCAMIRWSGATWNDYPCACTLPYYVCEGESEFRPQ